MQHKPTFEAKITTAKELEAGGLTQLSSGGGGG